jgi:hypothetical protein
MIDPARFGIPIMARACEARRVLALSSLSELGAELANAIGFEDFFRLLTYGRPRLHVPKTPRTSRRLANIISQASLAALCVRYGGDRILLPSRRATYRRLDHVFILWLLDHRENSEEIASVLGMSRRMVQLHLESIRNGTPIAKFRCEAVE